MARDKNSKTHCIYERKRFVLILLIFAIVIAAIIFAVILLRRQYGKTIRTVVTEDTISTLDNYKSVTQLDLSGSNCYEAIEEYARNHPDIKVIYKLDLGAGVYAYSDTEALKLKSEEFVYPVLLEDLRYLHDLRRLTLEENTLSFAELAAVRERYPDVELEFDCNIGGTAINSLDKAVDLKSGEYDGEQLLDFISVSYMEKLRLDRTELSADQLSRLASMLPNGGLSYSVVYGGKEYEYTCSRLDLSSVTDAEAAFASELLRKLPNLKYVELTGKTGDTLLSLDSILMLYQANSSAFYNCSFDFYGQHISTDDTEIVYKNVDIGNSGVTDVRNVLPLLSNCKRFVLDDCGIDNEVMAELRDDFPDTKIVWRVHWQNSYSALTDVTIIRSGSYVKLKDDEGVQNLKYCTDVVFADLGHNITLTDISFLAYWKHIRVLLIDDSRVYSLEPLSGCTELQLLEIVKCFNLTDLSPLANCKNLRFINISNCFGITDLSPLYELDKLERVYFMGMYRTMLTDSNQIYELQEKLPNCKCYYTSPPESDFSGLYSVGWRLEKPPRVFTDWYAEISNIFRYRTRPNGEGIFNYDEEPDELFYFDENELTVFTADRSM